MQHRELLQPTERVIADDKNVAIVGVQNLEVLATDEGMGRQLPEIVAVEVNFGGVHRQSPRKRRVPGIGAIHDVRRPTAVVVARAVERTRHLAVARVKVAAVAKREAMDIVAAEELGGLGPRQRDVRLLPVVRQSAVDGIKVHDLGILPWDVAEGAVVDSLQPLRVAVADEGVSPDVELG